MAATRPNRAHRGVMISAALVASSALVLPAAAAAPPKGHDWHRRTCPAAEPIVSKISFARHTLAPGIVESAGQMNDQQGTVVVHTLRVDLTQKTTSFVPLVHHLTTNGVLSTLVKGHTHLVAASNTGYFDWGGTDAPTLPFVSAGAPVVASSTPGEVVGFTAKRVIESGNVWLSGTVTVGAGSSAVSRPVVDVNEVNMASGIGVYTPQWGAARVPAADNGNTFTRTVVNGRLGPADSLADTVPSGGYLLVAKGQTAENWLSNLPTGWVVTKSLRVKTDAAAPFVQAYGVGVTLVAEHGVAKTGFTCDSSNRSQPARTGIGFANKGKTMILAFVSETPGTSQHGLDNDQMSALMEQLGVDRAYNFDGSGSTELIAKLHASSAMKIQNYTADGDERQMPLGLGIAYNPPKAKHVKAKPKPTSKPKPKASTKKK